MAQSDGFSGHQTRHFTVLLCLHEVMRSVWGGNCLREPADYRSYSDHRPDVAALFAAPDFKTLLADLKLFDPIGSDGRHRTCEARWSGLATPSPSRRGSSTASPSAARRPAARSSRARAEGTSHT